MPEYFIETWDFVDNYINGFFEDMFVKSSKKHLFHFTNFNSFLGMIQNQEIWAFHTKFMNDPTESGLFLSCLNSHVNKKKEKVDHKESEHIDSLSQMISLFSKRDKYRPDETGHFIFSLSEAENSVGLWREYAGNGQGLALKLNRENLIESVKLSKFHSPLTCSVYEIKYFGYDEFNYFVDKFSEFYKKMLDSARDKLGERFIHEAFHEAVLLNLYSISALIKHKAYEEEKEHRLIVKCNLSLSNIEYIGGGNCIRPYIKLPFLNQRHYVNADGGDRLIEELLLGCNSHRNAEISIRLLWGTQKAKLCLKTFDSETTANTSFQTKPIFIKKSDVPIQAK